MVRPCRELHLKGGLAYESCVASTSSGLPAGTCCCKQRATAQAALMPMGNAPSDQPLARHTLSPDRNRFCGWAADGLGDWNWKIAVAQSTSWPGWFNVKAPKCSTVACQSMCGHRLRWLVGQTGSGGS